jgi:hypothetical protein
MNYIPALRRNIETDTNISVLLNVNQIIYVTNSDISDMINGVTEHYIAQTAEDIAPKRTQQPNMLLNGIKKCH